MAGIAGIRILRYFAFRGSLDGYDGRRLSSFLDTFMESKQTATADALAGLTDDFTTSLKRCTELFGADVFVDTSKERRRQSMVYYDLLMQSLAELDDATVQSRKEQIRVAFQALCGRADFQRTLSGGLQNRSSIEKRRQIWMTLLNDAVS